MYINWVIVFFGSMDSPAKTIHDHVDERAFVVAHQIETATPGDGQITKHTLAEVVDLGEE